MTWMMGLPRIRTQPRGYQVNAIPTELLETREAFRYINQECMPVSTCYFPEFWQIGIKYQQMYLRLKSSTLMGRKYKTTYCIYQLHKYFTYILYWNSTLHNSSLALHTISIWFPNRSRSEMLMSAMTIRWQDFCHLFRWACWFCDLWGPAVW